ncbi:MAG: hypothetical protein ABIF08_00235 [Nanoarchaeota archaeon]
MNDEFIKISKEEYLRLRMAELQLDRLEVGGVDNWEWYGESLNPDDDVDLDTAEKELEAEINVLATI